MQEEGECWCPTPGQRKAGQKAPAIFFYSVVWSAVGAAGLSAFVAVVSGSDVVQGGIFFFSLNLKGLF